MPPPVSGSRFISEKLSVLWIRWWVSSRSWVDYGEHLGLMSGPRGNQEDGLRWFILSSFPKVLPLFLIQKHPASKQDAAVCVQSGLGCLGLSGLGLPHTPMPSPIS